ncbi:MAG: carbohydrate binding family 9 domain-containing protein [Gemmatimonadota bacterium]|nr:carbohydrate binding family 9 domain-containing protein [Gemmatimonadota bacterium]MDH5760694.1 carbohydrate binding family 9 domain-containing protein [Gemmatimonadota bacterium]
MITKTLFVLSTFTGFAADTTGLDPAKQYDGSAGDLSVETPALEHAGIRVDGVLDDAAWESAALLHSFTQYEPVEGATESQRTEVLVLVDRDAIFFGVRAYDDNTAGIRATMAERDEFDRSDDYVRFLLDTFDDQRKAYVFTVNPLGVQQDGIWNEGGGSAGRRGGHGPPIDDNPDFLWESDGEITEWGYQMEVRIPFKSLRFVETEVQSWGLQVIRKIQRTGFEESWAPITGNIANRLAQSGKLTGLRNLDPGLFMEINPVLTGTRFGEYDDAQGAFRREDPTGDFGMNFTYGVTSNLTMDATYNPDFSQVEADAGQIQVNERFNLYFEEKRPFFLEGTEIFGMPKQLVYTRSIANPVGGAKLTGKVGSLSVGYLGAIDEAFPDADGLRDPNVLVNIARVRRDVGGASTVGAVYTDRTAPTSGEFNRVVGGDVRLVMARRYTLTVLGAESRSRDADTLSTSVGRMWSARFEQAGRTFSFNAEIEDSQDGFDAGSGFFRRVGETQVQSRMSYNWFGRRGSLVEQVGPSLELQGYWDHDRFWSGGGLQEGQAQGGMRVSFRNNITVWGNHTLGGFTFLPEQYEGLFVEQGDGSLVAFRPDQSLFQGLRGTTLSLWLNNWERVRGNIRATWKEEPIFNGRVAVEPAKSFSADMSVNLFPTRALRMELGLRHTTLDRVRDGVRYSTATIPRMRAQYQFSRAFFVRGIVEYSSQERGDRLDPVLGFPLVWCDVSGCAPRVGANVHDIHLEALVSYEPSPGTVFYVGYSREMDDPEAFGFRDMRPTADGLFVKLSYRFRM